MSDGAPVVQFRGNIVAAAWDVETRVQVCDVSLVGKNVYAIKQQRSG